MSEIKVLPILPLRDIVVFPHQPVPLFVGREKSVRALEEAMRGDGKEILLVTQKDKDDDDPSPNAIYDVGVVATILQLLKLPDGTVKVLVEGKRRAAIRRFVKTEDFFVVEIDDLPEGVSLSGGQGERTADDEGKRVVEMDALMREVHATFDLYVKLQKRIAPEILISVQGIEDGGQLADTIVVQLQLKLGDKQAILEMTDPVQRLGRLYELMKAEIEILQVERKIRTRVKKQMEKTQKEYYLTRNSAFRIWFTTTRESLTRILFLRAHDEWENHAQH